MAVLALACGPRAGGSTTSAVHGDDHDVVLASVDAVLCVARGEGTTCVVAFPLQCVPNGSYSFDDRESDYSRVLWVRSTDFRCGREEICFRLDRRGMCITAQRERIVDEVYVDTLPIRSCRPSTSTGPEHAAAPQSVVPLRATTSMLRSCALDARAGLSCVDGPVDDARGPELAYRVAEAVSDFVLTRTGDWMLVAHIDGTVALARGLSAGPPLALGTVVWPDAAIAAARAEARSRHWDWNDVRLAREFWNWPDQCPADYVAD